MRRPLRRLIILLPIVAVLAIGWANVGEAAARRFAGGVAAATREQRRQAELGASGAALWAYQRVYAPLRALPDRAIERGGTPVQGEITHAVIALPPVDPALATADIRAWYGRPPAERWAQYSSAGWRPIRLGTRGLWMSLAAIGAAGLARATGGSALKLPLLALAPLRFLALVLFRPRLEPSTSHGSARWAPWWTRLEVRLRRGRAQLALGRSWVGPLPVTIGIPEEEQFYHAVLVAPPGAGKTSRVLIPNILRECLGGGTGRRERWRNLGRRPPPPRSFVASDPKGELVRATSRAARRNHDVYLLDFLHPERSHRWNPLANVRTALDADLLAETLVANTGRGKESFWEQLSHGLIAAAALHLVRTAEGWPPTLAELCALLTQQTPEAVLTTFAESPVPEVRAGAAQLREAMRDNERMKGAAFADLQNRLRRLNHPEIAATTADNEIDLTAFGQRPVALYLRFDQNRTELLAPLTALFYAQLFDTLMAQAAANPGGRLAVPTMFYLEEFGNIGVLPGVQRKMNQLRSYGVGFFLVLQNLAQLEDVYGEAVAEAIFESCWTRLCLAGVGTATGAAFSALAGAATTLTASQGDTRAITRLPWADSGSRGSAEAARPLLTPDELRTMGDRLLVVMGRRPPLLARTRPWYRDPLLRGLVPKPTDGDPLADDFRRDEVSPADLPSLPMPPPALVVTPGPSRDEYRPTASGPDGTGLSRRDAPAGLDAPGSSAAPTEQLPVAPAAPPRWSRHQAAILAALVAAGRPGAEISATELARASGLERRAVRRALAEIRGKLDLAQWDDIVDALRARGLPLPDAPPALVGAKTSVAPTAPVGRPDPDQGPDAATPRLTPAEGALLAAIAAAPAAGPTGWAAELGISASRVRARLSEVRGKLGLGDDAPPPVVVASSRAAGLLGTGAAAITVPAPVPRHRGEAG